MRASTHPNETVSRASTSIFASCISLLVDPQPAMKLRKHLRFLELCFESRPRLALDHPGVTSIQHFTSHQTEIVGIRYLADELAILLPLFFFFRLAASLRSSSDSFLRLSLSFWIFSSSLAASFSESGLSSFAISRSTCSP